MLKIYGTENSRAMRPIWTAEEMGLEYELVMMPFPPRVFMEEYLDINMLGTVPYLIDGDVKMTESVAMAQYLVEKYGPTDLRVMPEERLSSISKLVISCRCNFNFPPNSCIEV